LEPGDIATPIVKSRHDSADDGEILPWSLGTYRSYLPHG
jgi:hypothetical protein